MKKALVFVALLVGIALALSFLPHWTSKAHRPSYHAVSDVIQCVRDTSVASGGRLLEERSASAEIRGHRFQMADRLFEKVTGRPLYNDMTEFTIEEGTDTIEVVVFSSGGKAGAVRIMEKRPSPKVAPDLAKELQRLFPGIDLGSG